MVQLLLNTPAITLASTKAATAEAAMATAMNMRKSNSSTTMMFFSMPRRRYCISNDKQIETKAQKPNPMTSDKSQPRMSTIAPPLDLASAAPWTGRPRKGGLSPRSEGAVNSTRGRGRSSGAWSG